MSGMALYVWMAHARADGERYKRTCRQAEKAIHPSIHRPIDETPHPQVLVPYTDPLSVHGCTYVRMYVCTFLRLASWNAVSPARQPGSQPASQQDTKAKTIDMLP